jgi:hypothetical protein
MIVISMDSHTELVAKLKPFLPRKWHKEFDTGEVLAGRYFSKIIDAFSALTPDRNNLAEVGFTKIPDSGRRGGFEEYVRPLPIKERLAMIDADGVAAEFITPFIGAFSDNVDFLHERTAAYHRYFADYVSAAPFRFTGSTVANLICGMDTVLAEIDDAYQHGLRAISLPGKVSFVSATCPHITRATTTRCGRRWLSGKWRPYSTRDLDAKSRCCDGRVRSGHGRQTARLSRDGN